MQSEQRLKKDIYMQLDRKTSAFFRISSRYPEAYLAVLELYCVSALLSPVYRLSQLHSTVSYRQDGTLKIKQENKVVGFICSFYDTNKIHLQEQCVILQCRWKYV
jgi:hypothetical protein